jgi:Na+/melibiose symporter-like transporter
MIILGYGSWNFAVGGFSVWGPDYMIEYYDISADNASYIFGAVTVFNGIAATVTGSLLVDKWIDKNRADI